MVMTMTKHTYDRFIPYKMLSIFMETLILWCRVHRKHQKLFNLITKRLLAGILKVLASEWREVVTEREQRGGRRRNLIFTWVLIEDDTKCLEVFSSEFIGCFRRLSYFLCLSTPYPLHAPSASSCLSNSFQPLLYFT